MLVASILLVILMSWVVPVDLWQSDRIVFYDLWIVTDIDPAFCPEPNIQDVLGCTLVGESGMIIQIEEQWMNYTDPVGHDIFLHEYLHARCEHVLIYDNWHQINGTEYYDSDIDYWDTCGKNTNLNNSTR